MLLRATIAALRCSTQLERKDLHGARVEYLYLQQALRALDAAGAAGSEQVLRLYEQEKRLGRTLATGMTPSHYRKR